MLSILIALVAVGGGFATTPIKPPLKCPLPTGPYKPPKCGVNECFDVCSKPCPPRNCSSIYSKYVCKEECCRPECRCKDGYLRNDITGHCITIDECLFPCGPTEHFVRNSNKCQRTCANYKVTGPRSLCKPFTGCVCNKGRVRQNDDGTGPCILPDKCQPRKCPLNEHFEDCPKICLKESCISKSPDYSCQLPAIPLPCKPRCVCNKGYLRDSYGNCIKENCCPAIKKCPANEVYRCTSLCSRDSCARHVPNFKCPIGNLSVCIPACACKDGLLRNDEGICVPKNLCPKKKRCGVNEVAVKCATVHPPQKCESLYTIYKPLSKIPCTPGCDCRPGYLRNKLNICIPKSCCPTVPPNQCGPFQEYKKCGTACEPSCSDLDNPQKICTEQCVAGCFCKEGYVKDDQGNCVTRHDCPLPVCNRPNEEATACGSGCGDKTCDNLNNTGILCPAVCVRGCYCRKGYVRNPYGVCVLPDQCPPKPVCLQKNEEYEVCGSSCPDNCNNYKNTDRICTANCVSACNCKPGFVRNLVDKTCVKPEQCPSKKCTGQNEALNYCGSYCPVTCANRLNSGDWSCAAVCRVGCDCIPGTLRNDSGVCVPVDQCTPPVCRHNEIFNECGTACPLTCDNYKNPPQVCTRQCVTDCFCAKGYVRNRHMRCVKPEECEPICPAGEKFNECSAHCQDTCENFDQPNRVCTYQCQSGCVCEEGTVRRKDGKCVPPLECKPQPTCSKTEIYSPCSAHCEPTCENSSPNQPCSRICKPGCKCRDGLVRRKDGLCVKVEECSPKPTCSDTEIYSPCSAHCEPTCKNSSPNQPCSRICKPGCKCRDGLVRRKDGLCVKVQECSPKPTCSDTEIYSPCSSHCEPTCKNSSPNQPCSRICKPGCKCRDGLVRRKDGLCVKVEECSPKPTCSDTEIYSPCSAHCEPTCKNSSPNQPCSRICKPGCKCRDGLVRRKDGLCVKVQECSPKPTCSDTEIYSPCSSHCEPTCKNSSPNQPCSRICKPGCKCRDGLVRRKDGLCVKVEECSPKPTCSKTEIYSPCSAHCEPTCENSSPNQPCSRICKPGCKCRDGLVRRKDGLCVKVEECSPKPTCSKTEIYSPCSAHCEPTCENSSPNQPCSRICKPGCKCRDGLVRRKDGLCVKVEECSPKPTCSKTEIYSPCSAHCEPTCENSSPNQPCSRICKPGCKCRDGLVRRKDGLCVKVEECSPKPTCSDTEIYSPCSAHCEPTCKNSSPNQPCSRICKPGCKCRDGLVRRKDGLCVKVEECSPKPTCSKTEIYSPCSAHCEPTCENSSPNQPCSRICKPGCKCRDGLVRRKDGLCVKVEECSPKPTCSKTEIYSPCSAHCEPTCENSSPNQPCSRICKPGCKCRDGLVRRKDGLCVKVEECSPKPTCSKTEIYSPCSAHCEPTCENSSPNQPCSRICKPGCKCRDGLVRRKDGLCVKVEECSPKPTCSKTEIYSPCSAHCEPTCENSSPNQPCSRICKPGCKCRDGLVRRKDGLCVKVEECSPKPTCSDTEIYSPCSAHCEPTCKNSSPNQPCSRICKPGCKCRDGLVRRKDGLCVKVEECSPKPTCSKTEIYSPCSAHCEPTCENSSPNQPCSRICKPGCKCRDGLVRRKDGLCVKVEECSPKPTCSKTEIYSPCSAHCEPTCENSSPNQPCSRICKPGCKCRDGLVRRKDGLCVKVEECSPKPTCSKTEIYSPCSAHCEPTCENSSPNQPCSRICKPGCKCRDGLVRRKDGLCVKVEECSPKPTCSKTEIYSPCSAHCEPTCENSSPNQPCSRICKPGCKCRDGLVRRKDGLCVKVKECSPKPTCSKTEIYSPCSAHCEPTCENSSPNQPCSRICKPGCKCRDGLVRRKDGLCVKVEECSPKPTCSKTEIYSPCSAHCEPTCENSSPNQPCSRICKPGCKCRDGLVRRKDGLCVKVEECSPKPTCSKTEIYSPCSAHCEPTCENSSPNQPCSRICKPGCKCRDGLVRRKDGLCVKVEECSPKPTCSKTEIYSPCSAHCEPTCENSSPNQPCSRICKPGCKCRDGLVRRKDGLCVKVKECSPKPTCSDTEIYSPCSAHCEPTCKNSSPNQPCSRICKPGCKCRDGLVRRKDGLCVKVQECPPKPICSADEDYDPCSAHCEDTCESHGPGRPCTDICKPGCRCGKGLVRRKDGKCVKLKDCAPIEPPCPALEVYDPCSAHCEPTCENDNPNRPCTAICKPGCKCSKGLVRRSDGKCVKKEECKSEPTCPPLEHYEGCNAHCEPTCKSYGSNITCLPYCSSGCACNEGLVRNDDGKCVKVDECNNNPRCPDKERYVKCVIGLCIPKTCAELGYPVACPGIIGPCEGGCVCIENYLRDKTGKCIPQKDCKSCGGDFNATAGCGNNCGNLCSNYDKPNNCSSLPLPCQYNGCDCKKGYVFDSVSKRCIAPKNCPIPCNGDVFAEKKKCPNPCPPTCAKPNSQVCNKACLKEGCQCRFGYILGPNGKCIKPENCPDDCGCNGDMNAIVRSCPNPCPLTCENQVPRPCPAICLPTGCECKYGYILSKPGGKCIKSDQCTNSTTCSDPNAITRKCGPNEACRPTCAKPNAGPCPKNCVVNGCECPPGLVLSKRGGKCIKIEECPRTNSTCNDDPNAIIKAKPLACPSTCASPDAAPHCKKLGPAVGCECKPGYIRSKDGGSCILPDKCPGGNPCGPNANFAYCKVECPNNQCPVDDNRGIIACDPPYPCPSGCTCKLNHRRNKDGKCILASDCPPVNCTRQNEMFSRCPSACLRENCADIFNQPRTCNTLVLNCQPQCICQEGYFRNDKDLCVPAKQCPNYQSCDDKNAERVECASECQPTCAKPEPGPCILRCKLNSCVCKKGFILSAERKCIPVDQCPKGAPCNGGSNAVIKANPYPCPSTCSQPNASPNCKRYAPPVGCVCKPGFIKTTDDFDAKCIEPNKCPGGNPCGSNATFVYCNVNCPNNNCPVSDTRAIIACSQPYPCPSGCACKLNYRRRSSTNRQCISVSDCPPINCTRPNEVYNYCPSPCLAEDCKDVNNQPTTCNTLLPINCQPKCICKKGHFRNEKGICVPANQCPNQSCNDVNAERVKCAPAPSCQATCAVPNPGPCTLKCEVNQCVCKKGYILSKKGGKCVPIEQCPTQPSCNGDVHARVKACPLPCPSTCSAPNAVPCRKACQPVGCECKNGYILSEHNGKCILPDKCPGGNPCGRNETYASCKVPCPSNYCPVTNSPNRVVCEVPHPCYSGCICKINYRRTSVQKPECRYASECPPVKCDKNQVWSKCPSACLAEDCVNVNDRPAVCNTLLLDCQPKCICKKGYFRDRNGKCIPADQCPAKPIKCKKNEVYNPCRIKCPPQTCVSIYTSYDCSKVNKKCEPGCDCKSEYLRNGTETDECIPSELCPAPKPECGTNEHYEVNRNKCDLTCKSKKQQAHIGPCPTTSGCFCDDGYVRDSKGHCVKPNQCPKPIMCPANEVLSECYNSCQTTCRTRIRGDGKVCHTACIETGCVCKKDYLRHDNGTCVPISECSPPQCDANETYSRCGTACPRTCQNRGDNCTVCTKQCVEGCFCSKGFVRAENGKCVRPEDCPCPTCPKDEIFECCPPSCPATDGCSLIWSKFNCTGAVRCCKPQCRCKPGLYRGPSGTCITAQQCTNSPSVIRALDTRRPTLPVQPPVTVNE